MTTRRGRGFKMACYDPVFDARPALRTVATPPVGKSELGRSIGLIQPSTAGRSNFFCGSGNGRIE